MSTLTFSDTHNMVAFLEKPAESDGFHEIIDFLNANQTHYALIVNPTIYTSCIKQFWATVKAKMVNGERGIDCLPTATIFEELVRMRAKTTAWNEFSSTMASAIICLATNQKFNLSKYIFDAMLGDMSHHKEIYVNPSHIKKIFANMKRKGKDFSGRTPITIQPSTSKPQKKQSRRKQKKTIAVHYPSDSTADVPNEEFVPTHSNDPLLSEKKAGLRTHKFEKLYKVGVTRRVEYSDDESLGAQEDVSNQGRSIEFIDKDAEVSLVDETHRRSDDAEMFDTDALIGNEVFAENDMIEKDQDVIPKEVSIAAPSTTVMPPPDITEVEITLAQTLAKLKSAKSKVVIQEPVQSTATTAPSTIPKAKGITFRDAGESTTRTPTSVSSSSIKDKGKAKMDEPEVPLKKKDQIALDEEMARNLEAQIQAELIEEERLARKKEEEANIALIESWDNTQAMMEADFELAQRLQAEEQGEITIEERSRLFVELMNKRKKHFAKLRAEEKRRKPPTKAQKRNLMSTYLKNIGGYTYNQLKSKSYDEIQKLFDNEMKRVNTFIPLDSEVMKSKEGTEESSKRTEDELESGKSIGKKRAGKEEKQESSKRQRMEDDKETNEHEEAEEDDEAEMKKHMEVVQDDEEISIDSIPLATKPPIIVEYKIVKKGQKGFYHLIRADGSSNRYSSMIRMLQNISREDLETL
ncbi:hypothetical protein Tco_0500625 [Tanacetum coccineum]